MSNLSAIYTNILTNLGLKADVASSTGSANAKLAQLLARIESVALFEGTTGVTVVYPVDANPLWVTAGTPAFTWSAWSEIVPASTLAAHALVGILVSSRSGPAGYKSFEIGEGGSGSEVAKVRWSGVTATLNSDMGEQPRFIKPAYKVTANARISVRITATVAAVQSYIWLIFAPIPF